MEDWDIPDEDDFESRYADELELLDDFDGEDFAPPSKKSLNFHDDKKLFTNGVTVNNVCTNKATEQTKSKKRDCDEMFLPLSDDEDEDARGQDEVTSVAPAPCKKKARLSPGKNGAVDDTSHQIPNLGNMQSPLRQLQPSPVQSHNMPSSDRRQNEVTSARPERRKVFRRAPVSCDSVSITRMDGQRLYLSIKGDRDEESSSTQTKGLRKNLLRRGPGNSLQLLTMPFSVLRENVEEERRRKTIEESERLTTSLHRMLNEDSNMEELELTEAEIDEEDHKLPQYALWVEKYTPRYFTELLSDDAINRTLLKWLKLWDKNVFGRGQDKKFKPNLTRRKIKSLTPQRTSRISRSKESRMKLTGINNNNNKLIVDNYNQDTFSVFQEVDSSGRPIRKVALLCGPPGLGKTTLSHVIARHAGYNVVEMNASDDRSQEVFRNTIEASTTMKSVLGYNEKPNCLVIDEIDGAPAPAINVLLSVIKQKDSDVAPGKKGKKKKKAGPLSRPIICICNDQYAPALRQLRQVAFLVTFPPTIPGRLATRLLEISRQELINTDMTTLTSLCEKTDNDIRSCLNTLQFIHKRHGRVWLEHVQSMEIGQKDSHRSLFSIWQEIFHLPKPKRHRFAASANNENQNSLANNRGLLSMGALEGNSSSSGEQRAMTSLSNRFHTVLHSAMSSGQYEKVAQGLFENYLQVKIKDPSFEVVVSGTEWLEFSDFIEQAVMARQSYILQGYNPFLSVAFHLFYAGQSHSKLSYPSSQYESFLKETKTKNLVNTIKNESSPHIRQNINIRTACLELLPFILEIITPTLRPVNTQLFSAREKRQLAELIDTMIAYNLTYHQERNFEGQYTYVLDPNMEEAVKFPGLPQHRQLTYATKQLISREIELEKMRRAEKALTAHVHVDVSSPVVTARGSKKPEETKPKKPVVVLSLDTRKAKPRETKPALDFFGRPVKVKPKLTEGNTSSQAPQAKPSLIWFRFNEGYSNAVRKNVKVQEFL
ncbi:hypothetical protein OS493_026722 [Desmophyllum pertusum]|uniref:AAA+ ATPase domain-containing protein n=1 Tax=Desmophyllum pertusum TaxID=174260 RepID=A0A9W9ZYQ7_9CNID|nr:hypothetical protein OS493_026722 [Desmophyllum pertusum]